MREPVDQTLGLQRPITRRDFMQGLALPLAAAPGVPSAASAGDFEGQTLQAAAALHARRDGAPMPQLPAWSDGDEQVDLVVVGAGISGLAAAHLYRGHAPRGARILVLDATATPGGQAQRNEFVASNGQRLIGYGGSEALDSPSLWSPAAHALLRDVGIDLGQFESWYDKGFNKRHGLTQRALYFAPELWGTSTLVRHAAGAKAADWAGATPLAPAAQRDLVRLVDAPTDPWPALPLRHKRDRLARLTYNQLLVESMGLHPQLTQLLHNRTCAYLGAGTDASSALDAFALDMPGFGAMKLGDRIDALMSPSARQVMASSDDYIYHFPDGNATLARALVRSLVPAALPGSGIESLVLAKLDTAQLDRADSAIRIRCSASVQQLRHVGEPQRAEFVDVGYVDASGRARTVRTRQAVLACFHRVVPFLCPELPREQIDALDDQVKVPLLVANVQLRHWRAFARAGITGFELPGHLWEGIRIDMPVSIGRYRFAETPDDPVLLHLSAVVLGGPRGSSAREQAAAGRRVLQAMTFEQVERQIRALLQGALGEFGFDAAADIEALTLNRWPHGYAYEYMRPWDTYWPDGPLPIHRSRRGFGRIAIANADAGAYAYAHGAIDQATRAVAQLLPQARLPRWWHEPGPAAHLLKLKR